MPCLAKERRLSAGLRSAGTLQSWTRCRNKRTLLAKGMEDVQFLLGRGANVNSYDGSGMTPLQIAVIREDLTDDRRADPGPERM